MNWVWFRWLWLCMWSSDFIFTEKPLEVPVLFLGWINIEYIEKNSKPFIVDIGPGLGFSGIDTIIIPVNIILNTVII